MAFIILYALHALKWPCWSMNGNQFSKRLGRVFICQMLLLSAVCSVLRNGDQSSFCLSDSLTRGRELGGVEVLRQRLRKRLKKR